MIRLFCDKSLVLRRMNTVTFRAEAGRHIMLHRRSFSPVETAIGRGLDLLLETGRKSNGRHRSHYTWN